MTRQLTDKQQNYSTSSLKKLAVIWCKQKRLAGYADTSSTSEIVKGLKEEILEATQMYMARNAPKAAMAMVGGLYDPTELGIRDKMAAAKELLDRTGLVKTEKMHVEASGGVMRTT